MVYKLNINDRAALAIKNKTKRVEIRANKKGKINYPKYKNNTQTKTKSNVILKTTKRKLLQIHIIHIRNKINSI